jgi:hypothetical protein
MCLHKGMDFVEGPEGWWSVWWLNCCSQKEVLCEFSDMIQCTRRQYPIGIWVDVKNDNCIKQFMCLLHQLDTGCFVRLDSLDSLCEIYATMMLINDSPQYSSTETALC